MEVILWEYLILKKDNGDETYHEKALEKGVFTKFPKVAAVELGFYNTRDNNDNNKVIKLLEYDKKISGQSL